ncbi:hypothetical protein MP638_000789 [Amoeboaphelidium occidentale]|nr:hypothetical protein MP638_000789 [Amoeboaphelidium occidentale]
MTTPTKDTLIQKLQGYGLSQVVTQIDPLSIEDIIAFVEKDWTDLDIIAFVEKDWTDLGCSLAVAKAIYNHLHPSFRSLLSHALPPLGPRELSFSVSKTRMESAYSIQIATKVGSFGILDEFTRDKLNPYASSLLWTEAESGRLKPWSGEVDIQALVRNILVDCLELSGLASRIRCTNDNHQSVDHTALYPDLLSRSTNRADVTALVNDTMSIAGVCEVKLPGFKMDSLYQIVDYMVDLRNSFNVRFVFGVLTTYKKWRILWFEDTNVAAMETRRSEFDELCKAGTANDYSIGSGKVSVFTSRVYDYSEVNLVEALVSLMYKITGTANDYSIGSGKVSVFTSRVYNYSEVNLVEVLVSLMYKISMTPIASPQKFLEPHKKYIYATKDTVVKFDDHEVDEFKRLNHTKLSFYQKDPMRASNEALSCMLKHKIRHDDLKWVHVALLPSFSDSSTTVDLNPIVLDLTRTTQVSDTTGLFDKFTSDLLIELSKPE